MQTRTTDECKQQMESGVHEWITEADNALKEWHDHMGPYPWYAPRVLKQYFEMVMQGEEPIQWSIDNYDGGATWMEMDVMPKEQYKNDAEPSTTQRRELRNKLIQIEMETDEMMEYEQASEWKRRRWQVLRTTVQEMCEEAYQQEQWTRETLREMREMIASGEEGEANQVCVRACVHA